MPVLPECILRPLCLLLSLRVRGWGGGGKAGWGQDMGLPCLSQITFFCDLLLLYVDGEAHFYWKTKYEEVSCGPDPPLGAATLGGCWPEP